MRSTVCQAAVLAVLAVQPSTCQFMTTLQPRTVEEFDVYAHKVEAVLEQRWSGKQPFFSLDENPSERASVMQGELWVQAADPNNPIAIDGGLIHDWVGAVFIANADVKKVLAILQDFDRHSELYPTVKQSRVLSRKGNEIVGFWRLERKQSFVTVALDVTQDAHWRKVGSEKWVCRAYAKNIQELEHPGASNERLLPVGEGRGFLWRFYSYWSLQAVKGGVLAECRTLSLSRDIPPSVAWAVQPFVSTLPREALAATLRGTRAAAET